MNIDTNPMSCYQRALTASPEEISALTDIILSSGNPHYAYLLARDVPGVDVDACWKVACDSGEPGVKSMFILSGLGPRNTHVK